MSDICIIGVYFGKIPPNANLWLKSCAYNPTIDFLIISDQRFVELPDNVKVYKCTLEEMKCRASKALDMPVSLGRPYKCCDYKPIYGLIFSDLIKGYSYWGHCDFDLIFGDLRFFFNKYDLYKYDKFLSLGHLSLYRNEEEVINRFKLPGALHSYDKVYSSDQIFVFDEMCGIVPIYKKHNFPFFSERIFADITPIHRRLTLSRKIYNKKPDKNYHKQIFYWENGKVFRDYWKCGNKCKEEFAYIHFRERKLCIDDNSIENAFYIVPKGFIIKSSESTPNDVKMYNRYCFFRELIENIKSAVKEYRRRFKKVISKLKNG